MPPTIDELGRLQRAMLAAVLLRQPLLGSAQPVEFPDIGFVHRQAQIPLLDEGFVGQGPAEIDGLDKPIVPLSSDALAERARNGGDVAFLRFYPPEEENGAVVLTLAAALATPRRAQPMGLSRMRVRFRRGDGGWTVDGDPVMLAS